MEAVNTARASARVIVFDPTGRVLLLHTSDLCAPPLEWWELPGGGIEPEESADEAAARELREETGISVASVGPCIASVPEEYCFAGKRYRQTESVFAVFLQAAPTITPSFVGSVEAHAHRGHGWWDIGEQSVPAFGCTRDSYRRSPRGSRAVRRAAPRPTNRKKKSATALAAGDETGGDDEGGCKREDAPRLGAGPGAVAEFRSGAASTRPRAAQARCGRADATTSCCCAALARAGRS